MDVTPESYDVLVNWWTYHCPEPAWYDVVAQVLRHIETDRWDRLIWREVQVSYARRRDLLTEVQGLHVIIDLYLDDEERDVAHLVSVVFDQEVHDIQNEWDLP